METKYIVILIILMYLSAGLGCWIVCMISDRYIRQKNYEKLSDQGKKFQRRLDRGR